MKNLEKLKYLNIDFPEIDKLNASTVQERYFKIHYTELYKLIIKYTDKYKDYKWSEKLYMFYNDIFERPKCPVCGKECKFYNITTGYAKHCSRKCISKSELTKHKKEQTSLEKYGVKNPMQSNEIKNKIKNTCLEKYGVECVYQSEDIKEKIRNTCLKKYGVDHHLKSNIVKTKIKNTCLEKYGVEYISQSTEFKDICKNACLEKYGVDHPMKSELVQIKVRQKHKEKYGVEYISQRPEVSKKTADTLRRNHMKKDPNIIGFTENYEQIIKCPHADCEKCSEKYFISPGGIYHDRLRINAEVCTRLLPIKALISTYEIKIQNLLDKYNIKYISNARNIISKELDIFIPSKNIAIEFNGIYWHSDKNKISTYHINKYNECKDKGIKLISIWEDQYINYPEIINSIILHKLGITQNKVYARKCNIVILKSNEASKFYNENHLQGKCSASIHYGLIYNNEIVCAISFGKRTLGNNSSTEWELIRYCCKLNTSVIGGVSKLFKYFITNYKPEKIISWSSNDISNGDVYKLLGFDYSNISKSYWYISYDMKRYHRFAFSKQSLIKKGIVTENDNRSESEIMKEMPYYRIFDSGQTKWVWNKTSF